jgi:hypothetical protein
MLLYLVGNGLIHLVQIPYHLLVPLIRPNHFEVRKPMAIMVDL